MLVSRFQSFPLLLGIGSILFHALALIDAVDPEQQQKQARHDSFTEDEATFLDVPSAKEARDHLKYITSVPHVAGTPGDYQMAKYVQDEFEKAGIPDVSIFDLKVLLNYPNIAPQVTLSDNDGNAVYEATLTEDILPDDPTSDTVWRNHSFHGYSPSGRIMNTPMVYANYGRPQDFDVLQRAGISVEGTVVIVRYGQCFRGIKVQNAQNRGALGVLIYSDPADDGAGIGPTYPDGPWRSESSFQRGSVQFNSLCAGDPQRADPRYGDVSVEDICGYSKDELIPSIPSLPLNARDVRPLLERIGGPKAADLEGGNSFVGKLSEVTYRVGPSKDYKVSMVIDNVEELRTVPNVIAKIPGWLSGSRKNPENEEHDDTQNQEAIDMPILLGNHRDAWVYGAADPNSGTAALLEVARGFGTLIKEHNWQPERTIYLLSWSGEEYGLLGSTGWGELNGDTLLANAAAYLNVDTVVSGNKLEVSATPSLATVWRNILEDLQDSSSHACPWLDNGPFGDIRDANTDRLLASSSAAPDEIGMLGSGSDYTVFLDHLGIASMDFNFQNPKTGAYGQYHSIHDSFSWIEKFGGAPSPPNASFDLITFAAKIWGLLAMRLSTDDIIPIDHIVQGQALKEYVDRIEQQQLTLDLCELKMAAARFREAAAQLQIQCFGAENKDSNADDEESTFQATSQNAGFRKVDPSTCNEKLGLVERKFLIPDGDLPNRPWFKHILQAPGLSLGYAAQSFPGIQQAIDDGDLELAQEQVKVAADQIHLAANFLTV